MAEVASRGQVVQRQNLAMHGVFQREQATAGEVKIVWFDRSLDTRQIQRSVGFHFDRLGLDRAEHGRSAALVFVGMGLLPDDVFIATLAVRHQRQQIAHGAGRHEHPRREA